MSEPLHCANHPNVETYLRCNKCGKPICTRCAVQTPVGYRCRECVNSQQRVFYANFRPVHYLIAGAVALPLSLAAGWVLLDPRLSWYVLILGPLVGLGIAEVVRWALRRRRGQYVWLVVCACIVVGALPRLILTLLLLLGSALLPGWMRYTAGGLMSILWFVVYVASAAVTAYLTLRPGRRV